MGHGSVVLAVFLLVRRRPNSEKNRAIAAPLSLFLDIDHLQSGDKHRCCCLDAKNHRKKPVENPVKIRPQNERNPGAWLRQTRLNLVDQVVEGSWVAHGLLALLRALNRLQPRHRVER